MSSKQDIIDDTYFGRGGFGSKARTLQEARKKDKTITADDVNEFFRKNVVQKRKTEVFGGAFLRFHARLGDCTYMFWSF